MTDRLIYNYKYSSHNSSERERGAGGGGEERERERERECVCVCACSYRGGGGWRGVVTYLSFVIERPTKSVCKQCHVLHFIVHFGVSVQ